MRALQTAMSSGLARWGRRGGPGQAGSPGLEDSEKSAKTDRFEYSGYTWFHLDFA